MGLKNRISVIIPCYNASRFLSKTLTSVLAQTFPPDEVIIVDDGSKDDSAAIARSFGYPIRVVSQENQGECAARNRGIDEAQGDWLAFLDADDVWEPAKLARQVEYIEQFPDSICIHTGFYCFGKTHKKTIPDTPQEVISGHYDIETLLFSPLINTTTAMVKTGLPVRFPIWARQGGDMLYFTALSQHGRILYIPELLAGYRMHAGQITREGQAWVQHFRNRFRWLDEAEPLLGVERSHALRGQLRHQVVAWLELARWNRQWERYLSLQKYAQTLDWQGVSPSILHESLLPKWLYKIKDTWDVIHSYMNL